MDRAWISEGPTGSDSLTGLLMTIINLDKSCMHQFNKLTKSYGGGEFEDLNLKDTFHDRGIRLQVLCCLDIYASDIHKLYFRLLTDRLICNL